jgi:phosphomannomutase
MQTSSSQSERHDRRLSLLQEMILSASGWRTVFGNDDHALTSSIDTALRDITAVAADAYLQSVFRTKEDTHGASTTIVVATDSRPTGPAIADTVLRVCLARGVGVRWLGIAPTPETLAYVATNDEVDGFFYVTASHNPPGHNGFKMGYGDGSVMPGEKATVLIDDFRRLLQKREYVEELVTTVAGIDPRLLEDLEQKGRRYRSDARAAYRGFALECSAGRMGGERFFQEMQHRLSQRPLGIVGELNGSARSTSIDRTLLPELGIATAIYNDVPGTFAHQILPEGAGLDEAARVLAVHGSQDPAFSLAYVPDNDGDRGNLVFLDGNEPVTLDAQTVFALVVMIELYWTRYLEQEHKQSYPALAVVANGPTSCRIDEICNRSGAHLYRAEVGEANAVSLAQDLRASGMHVVVLGEGSNGGNITPPSTVRDPLSTLLAMAKLHAFRLYPSQMSEQSSDSTDFVAVARALPRYATLPTDDPRAKMQIGSVSHADLKHHYEQLLADRIPAVIERLTIEYGGEISWAIHNYEGTNDRVGVGARTGEERGGLKILFYHSGSDTADEGERPSPPLAFVWMRGSGTEPVFRILADCRGDNEQLLDDLVSWQRELVSAAAAAGGSPHHD